MDYANETQRQWKQLEYLNLEITPTSRVQVSAFNLPCFSSEPVEHCLHSVSSPQLNLCCDLLLLLVQRQSKAPSTILSEINEKLEFIRDSRDLLSLRKLSASVSSLAKSVSDLQEQVIHIAKQLEASATALSALL